MGPKLHPIGVGVTDHERDRKWSRQPRDSACDKGLEAGRSSKQGAVERSVDCEEGRGRGCRAENSGL